MYRHFIRPRNWPNTSSLSISAAAAAGMPVAEEAYLRAPILSLEQEANLLAENAKRLGESFPEMIAAMAAEGAADEMAIAHSLKSSIEYSANIRALRLVSIAKRAAVLAAKAVDSLTASLAASVAASPFPALAAASAYPAEGEAGMLLSEVNSAVMEVERAAEKIIATSKSLLSAVEAGVGLGVLTNIIAQELRNAAEAARAAVYRQIEIDTLARAAQAQNQ